MITKLISDIEYAFATVEYPGDYNIAPIDGMEGSEVNDIFKGKSWRDIHFEAVSQLSYALLYFKPKAFIYFLPAFLIGCIKDQKGYAILDRECWVACEYSSQAGQEYHLYH